MIFYLKIKNLLNFFFFRPKDEIISINEIERSTTTFTNISSRSSNSLFIENYSKKFIFKPKFKTRSAPQLQQQYQFGVYKPRYKETRIYIEDV